MLESSFVTHVKQEGSLTHFDQGLFLLDLLLRWSFQPTVFGQCLLPFFLSHLRPAAYLQETPITPQTKKDPTCLLVLMLALHCIALICYNYNAGADSLFVRARLIHTKLPMLCTSCLDSTCPCFPSKSQLRLKYKPDFVLFCHVSFNSESPAEPNLTSENQNIKEVKISKINAGERRKG